MSTVLAKNKTTAPIIVEDWHVYYIDSTNAEIVTVKDNHDVKFNAFKFYFSGTLYYYVLDGIHNTWTDDLSRWGYSEVQQVVLPTVYRFSDYNTLQSILPDFGFDTNLDYNENNLYVVQTDDGQGNITRIGWETVLKPPVSSNGNFGTYNWLDNGNQGTPTSVSSDSVVTLYIDHLTPAYDVSKSYGVMQWQTTSGTTAGRTEFALVNSSGNVVAKNVSSSTQSFCKVKVAVCSSSDATIITVYDSNNVSYNAFKYVLGSTDYYYVLDEAQTDWTDDLSSIGYHELSVAYLSSGNKNINYYSWYALYQNSDGTGSIPFDSNVTYTFDSAYLKNGTKVDLSSGTHAIKIGRPGSTYTVLYLNDNVNQGGFQVLSFTAYKVLYHAT